jgi:hypothetical protein
MTVDALAEALRHLTPEARTRLVALLLAGPGPDAGK